MKEEKRGVDRHKIENEEIDFTRKILREVPDGMISKKEAIYKRCKRRADSLNKVKDGNGNNLFPNITTAKEYIDYFKNLVEEENLRYFEKFYKEDFASYVYHFIINKGYEFPLSFEEFIRCYGLMPYAVKTINEIKELFFDNYYKALKEIRGLIETEQVDYYEYCLSLVKKNGGKYR